MQTSSYRHVVTVSVCYAANFASRFSTNSLIETGNFFYSNH